MPARSGGREAERNWSRGLVTRSERGGLEEHVQVMATGIACCTGAAVHYVGAAFAGCILLDAADFH